MNMKFMEVLGGSVKTVMEAPLEAGGVPEIRSKVFIQKNDAIVTFEVLDVHRMYSSVPSEEKDGENVSLSIQVYLARIGEQVVETTEGPSGL